MCLNFLEEATVLQGERGFKFLMEYVIWCVIEGGFFVEWCLMVVFSSAMAA